MVTYRATSGHHSTIYKLYELRHEKTSLKGFRPGPGTNQAVQPQKMARGLKFWIQELEGLCSENKCTDQLHSYRQLICAFVFAYAKNRFSHDAAHVYVQ